MRVLAMIVLILAAVALLVQSDGVSNPLNMESFPQQVASDVVHQDPTVHEEGSFIEKLRSIEKSGESRIVGGNEVTPHSLPHQAALAVNKLDGQYFCGGSLISEMWVLTSASCLTGARSVLVILGAHNLSQAESTQQRINSTVFKIHPQWNPTNLQNNVALIRLPYNATLNQNVSPACLVPSNITFNDGLSVIASGWGKTSQTGPNTNTPILRSVSNPTISNQKCRESFPNYISNSTMCTDTSGGKGICTGDNGGPLTINDRSANGSPNKRQCQVGISSFVNSTCQAGIPAGFTGVSYYVDNFIRSETGILPCTECSGAMIIPSAIILACSLIFLRFTNLF